MINRKKQLFAPYNSFLFRTIVLLLRRKLDSINSLFSTNIALVHFFNENTHIYFHEYIINPQTTIIKINNYLVIESRNKE